MGKKNKGGKTPQKEDEDTGHGVGAPSAEPKPAPAETEEKTEVKTETPKKLSKEAIIKSEEPQLNISVVYHYAVSATEHSCEGLFCGFHRLRGQ